VLAEIQIEETKSRGCIMTEFVGFGVGNACVSDL
jgi:hypothetical protein